MILKRTLMLMGSIIIRMIRAMARLRDLEGRGIEMEMDFIDGWMDGSVIGRWRWVQVARTECAGASGGISARSRVKRRLRSYQGEGQVPRVALGVYGSSLGWDR